MNDGPDVLTVWIIIVALVLASWSWRIETRRLVRDARDERIAKANAAEQELRGALDGRRQPSDTFTRGRKV